MTNDTEDWEQLQALFHLAETTPEQDRARVLARHCADPELCRRVLAILAASHREDSYRMACDTLQKKS